MSSNGFASTLDLRPRESHRALRYLLWLHMVPLVALPFVIDWRWPALLLVLGVGLSWRYVRRHAAFGFGPKALTRLVWQPDSGWHVTDAAGREFDATLARDSYVSTWLMVLRFHLAGGGTRVRVFAGDELPEDSLRRLRARLLSSDTDPRDEGAKPSS